MKKSETLNDSTKICRQPTATLSKEGVRVTIVGMVVNIVLTIFKVIVGIIGNSAALIADGVHSLSDLLTDFVILFSIRVSEKPEDDSHHFGHKKIETLTSFFVGIMLFFAGLMILYEGAVRVYGFFNGVAFQTPSMITFIVAVISVVLKELLFRYTYREAKKIGSEMIEVNAWEHRSDAFASIGVAAGIGLTILLGEQWAVLDPILAVLLAFYILYIASKILYNNANDLMDASLDEETNCEIVSIVIGCDGVLNAHSLKTRKLGSAKSVDIHIMVDENLTVEEANLIQQEIEFKLKREYGDDTYVIVKIEPFIDRKRERELHILSNQ